MKPPTTAQNIRLPDAMWADLRALAEREERTIASLIRLLLRDALAERSQ